MLRLLSNHTPKKKSNNRHRNAPPNPSEPDRWPAVNFHQTTGPVAGTDGRLLPDIQCWTFKSYGHYNEQCPKAVQNVQTAVPDVREGDVGNHSLNFNQYQTNGKYQDLFNLPFSILCDSGSSIDTFKDRELLTNVHQVREGVTVLTNGGTTHYIQKGLFNGTLEVWYHPKGIANILSFKTLTMIGF